MDVFTKVEVVVETDDQEVRVVVPASTFATMLPIKVVSHFEHIVMVHALLDDIDDSAAIDVAKRAFYAACKAVVAWRFVSVGVALSERGVAFSVGSERMDLLPALRRLEPGRSSAGSGGTWPEWRGATR